MPFRCSINSYVVLVTEHGVYQPKLLVEYVQDQEKQNKQTKKKQPFTNTGKSV